MSFRRLAFLTVKYAMTAIFWLSSARVGVEAIPLRRLLCGMSSRDPDLLSAVRNILIGSVADLA